MKTSVPQRADNRKKLKDRFVKAPEALSDDEIVELLLGYVIKGKNVKPQSKAIMSQVRKICNIFEGDLTNIKGVGTETDLFFTILREFKNRIDYQSIENKSIDLNSSNEVFRFLRTKIGHSSKELFIILFLDTKNRLKGYKMVREGFINSVAISARDIIENAIKHNAAGVVIAHNHPTGDATPSASDIRITRQICQALSYTGINLIDHMIVAYHEYHSMNAAGELADFLRELKAIK